MGSSWFHIWVASRQDFCSIFQKTNELEVFTIWFLHQTTSKVLWWRNQMVNMSNSFIFWNIEQKSCLLTTQTWNQFLHQRTSIRKCFRKIFNSRFCGTTESRVWMHSFIPMSHQPPRYKNESCYTNHRVNAHICV